MKNLFIAALCLLFTTPPASFHVEGTWEGGDGNPVYLKKDPGGKNYHILDSTIVCDGTFSFSGPLVLDRRVIEAGGCNRKIMLEKDTVRIAVTSKAGGLTDISVPPSAEQYVLERAGNISTVLAMIDMGTMMALAEAGSDRIKFDSINEAMNVIKTEYDDEIRRLLDSSRHIHSSVFVIGDAIAKNKPFDVTLAYYEQLAPEVKDSYAGKWLQTLLEEIGSTQIGSIAPDIALPSPNGTIINLYSLRGKYVLIDFWASWCAPCLAEAPNVKNVYETYRDKGFEVYGVSLDEKEEAWKNAIGKNGLGWIHVSSLQGWKCPAAKRYGVTGIPKTFLIDPAGRIVAIDLRSKALGEKIASIFTEN